MVVRFGAGAYFGMGVVTPYGTTGTNASIDFLLRAQEGTDNLSYRRSLLDPKDLSSYDSQYDQVQAGEEMVEGSVSDKLTYGAMADILRMFNGANPTVSGANPYVYSFTGASKPSKFSDPNHYQAGTTTRNWCIEMYKGSIVRGGTETIGAATTALSDIEATASSGSGPIIAATLIRNGGTLGVGVSFVAAGIMRFAAGTDPWTTAGYYVGATVTVADTTTPGNAGSYLISAIGGGSNRDATVTTIAGAAVTFTAEAFKASTQVVQAWNSTNYKRGTIVTIDATVDIAVAGVYVVHSVGSTNSVAGTSILNDTLLLRTADNWFVTDQVPVATYSDVNTTVSSVYYESTFYQGCNIKSLKLNFARNDYVQRSMDFMGTTANTGASSHSYRTPRHISNAEGGGNIVITATTITIDATPGWIDAGYVIGGTVTLLDPENAANATSFVITALTATVLTTTGLTANADDDTVHFTGDSMTNLSRVPGGTPASQPTVWVNDYAVSNPGQGATKFLTLGGTAFICREAELTIEEPLEWRYDIGQSSSELPLPEKKRSVKLTCTLETSDEKFLEIVRSPGTKAFGASGGDYTGSNILQILGSGVAAGRSLVFNFPRLVIEGDSETRVEGIGPTTAQFELTAMSDDVNNPAYTVVVTNGDAAYRT